MLSQGFCSSILEAEFHTPVQIQYVMPVTHHENAPGPFSVQPHDRDANVFGRPPIFDQKVDHAFGFDEQIAAQKEDPKNHSQGEDTKNSDLDHSVDEKVPFIG